MKFSAIIGRAIATLISVGIIITGGIFVVCGGTEITTILSGIGGVIFGILLLILIGKSIFELGKKAGKESQEKSRNSQ